ncbi:hypothetical protein T492DRAFT_854299 [Pavlovales sp. CCMP2436]|nr:hypothetical protein T492DRAFT_854299 [Pavlovales sp. CCMP2436]
MLAALEEWLEAASAAGQAWPGSMRVCLAGLRGNTTNSNLQIISLNALARAHYRRSIGTRGGAQASAAD